MKQLLSVLEKVSDITNAGAKYLLMGIIGTMLFSTSLQVLCRYVFSAALSWPEEVNVFFMTWMTFVGSSIALKTSEHISVKLLVNRLSPLLDWGIRLLGNLIISFIVLLIIRYGVVVAMMNTDVVSDALEIPLVIPRFSLVVGGVMMLIQLLYILGKNIASCPWLQHGLKDSV